MGPEASSGRANHESSGTKRETRVAKMFQRNLVGHLKATESAEGGTSRHAMGVPLACSLCAGQSRSGVHTPRKGGLQQVVEPRTKLWRKEFCEIELNV